MTTQATIDYLKTRVVSSTFTSVGDVTTTSEVVFDNGFKATGVSVVDINGFDPESSQKTAYENAVSSLYPGIDFANFKAE